MKDKALPSTVEQKIPSRGWGMVRKAAVSGLGFPIRAAHTWLGHWPLFQVMCCAGSDTRWFFFYVPFTVQALLGASGILAHCSVHEYRGNSCHMPGTRKLKAPQWLKMGLNPWWRHTDCESESQTYHFPYLPLWKKISAVLVFCTVFSLGQCTSHVVLSLYCKSMELSL